MMAKMLMVLVFWFLAAQAKGAEDAEKGAVIKPPPMTEAERRATEIELAKLRVQEMKLQLELQQLQAEMDKSGGTENGDLVLLGVVGLDGHLQAWVRVGDAEVLASPGDYITSRWRVKKIESGRVVLASVSGKQRILPLGSVSSAVPARRQPLAETAGAKR